MIPRISGLERDIAQYQIIKTIHKSSFAKVIHVQQKDSIQQRVIKIFKSKFDSQKLQTVFSKCFECLKDIDHPVVSRPLRFTFVDQKQNPHPCFFFSPISGGTLSSRLKSTSLTTSAIISVGILHGLQHLYQHRVIHGCLNLGNIMINDDMEPVLISHGLDPLVRAIRSNVQRGVMAFTAPELFRGSNPTAKSDIFSFGMVLYSIFSKQLPFSTTYDQLMIPHMILEGQRPPLDEVPECLRSLITDCWKDSPDERPNVDTAIDILNSAVTSLDIDKNALMRYMNKLSGDDGVALPVLPSVILENKSDGKPAADGDASEVQNKALSSSDEGKTSPARDKPREVKVSPVKKRVAEPVKPKEKKRPMQYSELQQSIEAQDVDDRPKKSEDTKVKSSPKRKVANELTTEELMQMAKDIFNNKNHANPEQAFNIFQRCAKENNPEACYYLGMCFESGVGTPVDASRALYSFRQGTELQHTQSMVKHAHYVENGIECEASFEAACMLYSRAAAAGNPEGLFNKARCQLNDPKCEDKSAAVNIMTTVAEVGNVDACMYLGTMYQDGVNVEQDMDRAVEFYERAHNGGCAEATFRLGLYYVDNGNRAKGTQLLKSAAKQIPDADVEVSMLAIEKVERSKLLEILPRMRELADEGHTRACLCLGTVLINGNQVDQNIDEGLEYLRRIKDENNEAAYLFAKTLSNQNPDAAEEEFKKLSDKRFVKGVCEYAKILYNSSRFDEAREYLNEKHNNDSPRLSLIPSKEQYKIVRGIKALANEDVNAMYAAACCLLKEPGYPTISGKCDMKNATDYLKKAAEKDHGPSITKYVDVLVNRQHKCNEEAFHWAKIAADQGECEYQMLYSRMLQDKGDEGFEEALKYMKMAADQGNPQAQCDYGGMLEEGQRDLEEAAEYYEKAVKQGNILAMSNLGDLLFDGRGIPKDEKRGRDLLMYAAEHGDPHGLFMAATWYEVGAADCERNLEKSAEYARRSAEGGCNDGMLLYISCLRNGKGVEKDVEKARVLYEKLKEKIPDDMAEFEIAFSSDVED